MLASEFGTGEVFISLFFFAMIVIWFCLVVTVVLDIFRSHDLSGFAKFAWLFLVLIAPYLGVFVYIVARGEKLHQHDAEDTKAAAVAAEAYVRQAAAGAGSGVAGELQRLADLRDNGVITADEFDRRKAQILQN